MEKKAQADLRRRVEERRRSGSYGNVEEMLKRKKDSGEGKGIEGEIFDRSKKTMRSPVVEMEGGSDRGNDEKTNERRTEGGEEGNKGGERVEGRDEENEGGN